MEIKQKLMAMRAVMNASNGAEVTSALNMISQKPIGLLLKDTNEKAKRKGFRLFLLVMALLAIAASTYLAYVGGGYLAEYVGPVAILFGCLDATIVILLYADAVKAKLRFILILFEIASLLYLGYAMGGYFGGGNARTAAVKKLTADYAISKEHAIAAQTISGLMARAIDNAKAVAEVELQRDGKGIVYEKANFIASMKASTDTLRDPSLPVAPRFEDLTAANEWLQDERQAIANRISKYDASFGAIKNQAKSTYESLQQALSYALKSNQSSNIQVLAASMNQIANQVLPKSKLDTENVLTPDDLKVGFFQQIAGFIIDFVTIFFVVVLAFQRDSDKSIDLIKDQALRSIAEDMLLEADIDYDPDSLTELSTFKLYELTKKIFNSEALMQYLKTKSSFPDYVQFLKEQPELAGSIENSQWSIADIRKELARNQNFNRIAAQAILFSQTDWVIVNSTISNPEDLSRLDSLAQQKFLKAIKLIRSKGIPDPEIKKFIGQFLLLDNPSENFIPNLEIAAEMLRSAERMNSLNSNFLNTASPKVMEYLCKTIDSDNKFKGFATRWTNDLDVDFRKILESPLVAESVFDQLLKIVAQGGINQFKEFINIYKAKNEEIENNDFGNKKLGLKPDLSSLKKALENKNEAAFYEELRKIIIEKNENI